MLVDGDNVKELDHVASNSVGDETETTLPDGGYGWVIIYASFMCHFVCDGIDYSFGLLYVELLEQFGESKAKTAWVGSLFVSMPLLCAPIAGFFVNKYGCRLATLFGAGLTSVALAVSSFAPSIDMLCVTYGVAAGLGLAFIYVPASVIPSFWFEKKRALATGIAVSGSGVGTFVMAPLIEYLIVELTWRGSLLVLSGIAMQVLVFGALFREFAPAKTADSKLTKKSQQKMNYHKLCLTQPSSEENTSYQSLLNSRAWSSDNILYKHCNELQDLDTTLLKKRSQSVDLSKAFLDGKPLQSASRMEDFLPISLVDQKERMTCYGSCQASLQLTAKSDPIQKKKILHRIAHQTKQGCDLTLLAMPMYLLYFLANFLIAFVRDFPYLFLPDYAQQLNIEKGSLLISIIGIVSTIGQVIYGFIGDMNKVNVALLFGGSMVMSGIAMLLVPSMSSYGWLALFSTLFGFFMSANYSLETVVVINILSLDELTKAYSLLLFGQGVASLIGPPVGGFLWDLTKSYSSTFYLAGTVAVVSGILAILILPVKRMQRLKKSYSKL